MQLRYPAQELTDSVIALRPWRLDDLECVREAATDPNISSGTTVPSVFTTATGRAFVERQWSRLENNEGLALALTDRATDEAVGHVFLGVRPQSAVLGLGYWVIPKARGRGLAARAARLATEWAFGRLGAARVEAWVIPGNEASLKTLMSAGFVREGVLRSVLSIAGERSDAIVLSRLPSGSDQ